MSNFSMNNIQRAVDSARNSGLGDFLFQEPASNRRGCGCSECNRRRTSRRPQTSRPVKSNCCSCHVVERQNRCTSRQVNPNRCTCRVIEQAKRCTSRNQRRTERKCCSSRNQRPTNRNRRTSNNQRPSNSNGCNQRGCGGVHRRNRW